MPPALPVSTASVSERRPMPRVPNASTVSISCLSERARRSSFQTTSVSPARMYAEGRLQGGALALRARRLLLEHLGTAGRLQGVELQGEVLLLRGHPGVADQHVASRNSSGGYVIGQ